MNLSMQHAKSYLCTALILLIFFCGNMIASAVQHIPPPIPKRPILSNPMVEEKVNDTEETQKEKEGEASTISVDETDRSRSTINDFDFENLTVVQAFENDITVNSGKVSVHVINYPVHDLLNTVFKKLGKTVLISSRIREQISIQLNQVTPEELLDYISAVVGINWSQKNDVFLVSTENKLTDTTFFQVKNSDLKELQKTLITFGLGNKLIINAHPRGIIVNADPATIKKIGEVIAELDQPVPSIKVEFQVLEINKDEEQKLGIAWQDIVGTYQHTRLYGSANTTGTLDTVTGITKSLSTGLLGTAQKLSSVGKILAKPYVITTNNLEAHLSTGDEIPIFSKDYNGNPAVEYKKVGIELYATPAVLNGDIINIKAKTIVNIVSGQETQQGLTVPRISSREAQTTMNVKSGETIVIGGLIKEEDIRNETVVPFFSKLPLVGSLFRTSNKSKAKTEIVIFITPTLISAAETSDGAHENK
jgi:type IV pilus assembly protein PilQ